MKTNTAMVLKKLVREKKKKEVYSAGDRNPHLSTLKRKDFVGRIQKSIRDWCEIIQEPEDPSRRHTYGGPIPDRIWKGEYGTDSGEVELKVTQAYAQPGARLIYAEAEIRYGPLIDKQDLQVIRDHLILSGLEKKV